MAYSLKALIVEDEELLIDVLKNNFRKWEWECVWANTVPAALSLIDESIDVVITDIRLPRLTGIDLLKNVKDIYPDLEIILMTAYEDMDMLIKAINLGAFSFLYKPLELKKLKEAILRAARMKFAKTQIQNYQKNLEDEVEKRTHQLRESKERYQKVVQLAPACIWTADKDGNFLSIESDEWAKLIGYNVEEMERYSFSSNPWETDEAVRINEWAMEEILKGKFVRGAEEPIKKKSGDVVYVAHNIAPTFDGNNQIDGCIGVTTDITDRKEAQEHLKMMGQTIRSVNYCICIADMDKNITFINSAFTKTYGYPPPEILGKNIGILWENSSAENNSIENQTPDLSEAEQGINALIDQNDPKSNTPAEESKTWEGESQHQTKKGDEFPVALSVSQIKNDKEEPIAFVIVSHDITELKALQKEFVLSEKLTAAGKIAAGVAHELRNMLAAISTSAQFCLDNLNPSPQMKKHLSQIEKNLDDTSDVLEKLLNFARPNEFDFTSLDLNETIKGVLNLVQAKFDQKGIELISDLEKKIPFIRANASRIRDLMMNLLLNAYEASGKNSAVTISTILEKGSQQIVFQVMDMGAGIPAKDIKSVFEPFFTTKSTGTGLGLSICQQIVDEHNGEITVANNKNSKGCTFTVKLPSYSGIPNEFGHSEPSINSPKTNSEINRKQK